MLSFQLYYFSFFALQLPLPLPVPNHFLATSCTVWFLFGSIGLFFEHPFYQLCAHFGQFRFYRLLYLGQRRFRVCLAPTAHFSGYIFPSLILRALCLVHPPIFIPSSSYTKSNRTPRVGVRFRISQGVREKGTRELQ